MSIFRKRLWTVPTEIVEIEYKEFVTSVTAFYESFFAAMDKQVENAVAKDWGMVSLDKERLVRENEERKAGFFDNIKCLNQSKGNMDWDNIMGLYGKMNAELFEK